MKRFMTLSVLLSILFFLAACSGAQTIATSGQVNAGKPAPDFELVDLQGETHKLSEYEGKKVYIKFWASWCSICLSGMNELNTLAGENPDFEVLTIVSPSSNAEKSSESFVKWFEGVNNASNIQVLLDEGGSIFDEYGVIGYPTSVYIGSDGVMVKSQTGHVGNEQIYETFEDIQ